MPFLLIKFWSTSAYFGKQPQSQPNEHCPHTTLAALDPWITTLYNYYRFIPDAAGASRDLTLSTLDGSLSFLEVVFSDWWSKPMSCVYVCSVMSNSFATPWTVDHQASLSMGFPRQEYWSRVPFPTPGDLPGPGIDPTSLMSPTDQLIFHPSHVNKKI